MASRSSPNEHNSIFENLIGNIKLVSRQIKDGESKKLENETFNRDAFWSHLDALYKRLSMETTKLSLAFSKTPFPSNKNTEAMIQELEKSMLALVSLYYSFPNSQGTTLRRHLQLSVLRVLGCLESFATALSEVVDSESHSERLQWTGGVWESADFAVLKDNKECVLADLRQTAELVEDTLGEISEATECNGQLDGFGEDEDDEEPNNSSVWSEQDKLVIVACTGLVKTMKSVLKKTRESVQKRGSTETVEAISTLDELASVSGIISAVVDDFVSGIYAPVNFMALHQNGKVLSELIQKILKFLKDSSLTCNEDVKWLDFLSSANSHNLNKLEESTHPNQEEG